MELLCDAYSRRNPRPTSGRTIDPYEQDEI